MDKSFESTSWSVISAARSTEVSLARDALESLCQRYWTPLYTYVRLKGHTRDDAEDLTQEFFFRLLASDFLANLDRSQGKFRTYLLACLNHFLCNEWDRQRAAKRGGGALPIPLDFEEAEQQYGLRDDSGRDPAVVFDAQWAETMMASAERRLEAEYRHAGKSFLFRELKGFLGRGEVTADYGEIVEKLAMEEGAVRVALHRLRKRFAARVRLEIAATVNSEEEIQEELNYLIQVMSG